MTTSTATKKPIELQYPEAGNSDVESGLRRRSIAELVELCHDLRVVSRAQLHKLLAHAFAYGLDRNDHDGVLVGVSRRVLKLNSKASTANITAAAKRADLDTLVGIVWMVRSDGLAKSFIAKAIYDAALAPRFSATKRDAIEAFSQEISK